MRRTAVRLLGMVSLAMFAALPIVDAPAMVSEPWTICANEGQRCSFTGTQEVRYGVDTRWTAPRTFTGGVDCTNARFGDPAFGTVKRCERRALATPTPTPTPTRSRPDPTPTPTRPRPRRSLG